MTTHNQRRHGFVWLDCGIQRNLRLLVFLAFLFQLHVAWRVHQTGFLEPSPPDIAAFLQPHNLSSNADDQSGFRDGFNITKWKSNPMTNSCFVVEDLCHSTHHWFYNHRGPKPSSQPYPMRMLLTWTPDPKSTPMETIPAGYPQTIRVGPQIPVNMTCQYSDIRNHFCLHSFSNHMLGEFYARSFLGLWDIFQASEPNPEQFASHAQFYLHTAKILESHSLFLDVLTSNPTLPFTKLLDNTQCRCLKRLFFCGYETSTNANGTTIKPGRNIGVHQHEQDRLTQGTRHAKHKMRQTLLKRLVDDNSLVQQMIDDYRFDIIERAIQDNPRLGVQYNGTNEWKIVGLAQRSSRRSWKGLKLLELECNEHFVVNRVACVVVNIEDEEWANPVKHVVAHAALNALIGIHGAQLTEAVLMPPDSLVVELLPWIHPDIAWGSWARWVHRPTPLGVLFSDLGDLDHIGYPLKRSSSIDNCKGQRSDKMCFSEEKHKWDNRDFQLHTHEVVDVINRFVLRKPLHCTNWTKQAADEYVLYNVKCVADYSNKLVVRHFYREKGWIENKTS